MPVAHLRPTHWIAFLLALLASLPLEPLHAQQPTREAPLIDNIRVEFRGPRTVSTEAVMAHIRVRVGLPYSRILVDQSIRSLYATGLFEYINVIEDTEYAEGLGLLFIVVPNYKIETIEYVGNDDISARRLRKEVASQVGRPMDEVQVKRDAAAIFEYYQRKGFSEATVDYQIERDRQTGFAVVRFTINEGKRLKLVDVDFEGNEAFDEGDLEDVLVTAEYFFLWSWLTGSGRFKEDEFEDDLDLLREFYKEEGYLDIEIREDDIRFERVGKKKLRVIIPLEEGRQYRIGQIALDGNTLYEDDLLFRAVTIREGDIFVPSRVDEVAENLRDVYGREGYLDTFVRAERIPNIETGAIDLVYRIRESEQFLLESINLIGNTKTKSIVVIRELALEPGQPFDLVRMKVSEARLRNTRYFDAVNLSPEPINIPNRRNLRISLREGQTGKVTFGAGFSSVERVVAFAELTQSNFDLFNYRSFFQGDGQKFRLRLSIGSRSNQILLTFEEPWLFERRLAFGFEAFRTETDFNSAVFDELRTGFEVYFRKRLFELVEGRLSYRLEEVEIFDVSPLAPSPILDEEGSRTVSKFGFALTRDTRDDLIFPSRGSRLQFLTELAGGPALGETDYIRLEGRSGFWFPTFDFADQVLQVVGRIGTLWEYSDEPTPFFDRFFLGGPFSLRGFDFREVGPTDAFGEPLGGNSFAFGSIEYIFKIADPVRLAFFYDIGFVNSGDFDWDPADYNDNWGVGLRVLLLGAPLRLDLGFPLTTSDTNDDGTQFQFSFGTVF
ncbi:MAG: outer membrane protein assembly factor BamA [Opitutales bacterium]